MQSFLRSLVRRSDLVLIFSVIPMVLAGLVTMNAFSENSLFFEKQLIWSALAFILMFGLSFVDFRFLRRTGVLVTLFVGTCFILLLLFMIGSVFQGAQSWFNLGSISIQPSDPAKLVVILVLAKYFSRRHIEIANIRHIIVSGVYAFIPFFLVFLQPDFGSAIIIFMIWFGMILISGISKKHLIAVFFLGLVSFGGLWSFVFLDYQKQRIVSFIHPLADIQGSGYNAYQSTIAVGSGEILGKGVGFGTQSRLKFLPEYETDFIFASFAEEWGFLGVLMLFIAFSVFIWRVLMNAILGESNFEVLYGIGLAIFFVSHFVIHVGMNVGLLPVTGTTMPFMSYGGSHLLTEFAGIGILLGMRAYSRTVHRDDY